MGFGSGVQVLTMRSRHATSSMWIATLFVAALWTAHAETTGRGEVTASLGEVHQARTAKDRHIQIPPAVLWLKPLSGESLDVKPAPGASYTLLQKNKMFSPHLLIVPVGSVVHFPNKDPFFHNVFSLFDGKRFDLGLYEAGSTREVTFSREGVSYIFCNIHPEMSAVILSLLTPFYGIGDANGAFHLHGVPAGEYELHIWVEGEQQSLLDRLTKKVRVSTEGTSLGEIQLEVAPQPTAEHLNKFGKPYHPDETTTY
jgi:plastocyanin